MEEAKARAAEENVDRWVPALHWADEAGLMRGAVRKVLGGPVPGALRMRLVEFRKRLSASPGDRGRFAAPA